MDLPEPLMRAISDAAERVRPGASGVLSGLPSSAVPKITAMSLRAAVVRPRLGAAGPGLLVGRRVTLRDARRIRTGRGVIIEDGVEIQGRSRRGITLGSRVTVRNGAMVRPSSYYGRSRARAAPSATAATSASCAIWAAPASSTSAATCSWARWCN